jgi:hypothetical protein
MKHCHTLFSFLFIAIMTMAPGCKKDKNNPDTAVRPADFLSDNTYNQLLVELQCVNGYEPDAATVTRLKKFLEERLNKSAGITVITSHINSPGKSSISIDEARQIEKEHRSQNTHDRTLCAYFLFVDADYSANSGDSKVLGVAYGSSSMIIYEKTIREFSGGIGQPSVSTLESTVSLHEFGHILGLTNNGTGMQSAHQDEPNGKHCNNKDCLMYYTVENSGIVAALTGGAIPALDAHCLADLKANGGK